MPLVTTTPYRLPPNPIAFWVATYNGETNKAYSFDANAATWDVATGTVADSSGRAIVADGTQWFTNGNPAGGDTQNMEHSSDGLAFVTQNVPVNPSANALQHGAYTTFGGGVWVMTNATDLIRSTDGGANWTPILGHGSFGNVATGIAHDGAGNWAICSVNGGIQISNDNGATWPSIGTTTGIQYDWDGITYNTNDGLLYLSNNTTTAPATFTGIYTSNDGGASASRVYASTARPGEISSNDSGVVMASSISGDIVRKTAGGTWSEFTIPDGHLSTHIAAGKGAAEGVWVSVGGVNGAEIAVSTNDGDNWTVMADPNDLNNLDLLAVGYGYYYV